MAITPYAAGSIAARRSGELFVGLRRDLDALQQQVVTGQKSPTFGGLGLERRTSLDVRAKLSGLEGYGAAIDGATLRITLMTQGLERLSATASALKAEIPPGRFDLGPEGRTSAQTSAEDRLRQAIDILNTDAAGRFLFGGRASDRAPAADFDTIMNGDGTGVGLKRMIQDRLAADRAGEAGATVAAGSAGGAEQVTVASDDAARFGVKVAGLSSRLAGAAATTASAAGTTRATLSFTGNPAPGESFTLSLALPDGSTEAIAFTALAAPDPAVPNGFVIGASAAATRDNAQAAIQAAIAGVAGGPDLAAASAIAAAQEFFGASQARPPAPIASGPIVTWYRGEDEPAAPAGDGEATLAARRTAPARVDAGQAVEIGARANEPGLRDFLAQLGALAATAFADTPADAAAYEALKDRARANLTPPADRPSVDAIAADLAHAAVALEGGAERHRAAKAILADTLEAVETVQPEEAIAAMLSLQTRLQASYQTTAMLSQLSLVNFL